MYALFLELARTVVFFSSSPHLFRLRMISSMVVLAPVGEVAKTPPMVRLATHKLIVSVDADVGVELLATTLAGKHIATVLPNLMLCPPTLIPSSDIIISLTNLPSTPAGPVASK